jgi:transposase
MKFNEIIGIDVSKPFVDAFIHSAKKHKRFKNSDSGFNELINWLGKFSVFSLSETLFAFEHTGMYALPLSIYLDKKEINFILIPGLELKRSLGITRGKDDKIDAKAIALYAYRRRNEITPFKLPSSKLLELRRLLSLREKLVKQRSGFKATNSEIKSFLTKKDNITYFQVHQQMIKFLSNKISVVEKKLLEIISNDENLKKMYDLIVSIKGVGMQTALFEDSRKFASYAGIAPFPYQSGISIKAKTKVHDFANKKFKSLLTNCAVNAIVNNPEMRLYYQRRIKMGKNKMSTINIVRNKILARIFAVIIRGTPYVDTLKYAA